MCKEQGPQITCVYIYICVITYIYIKYKNLSNRTQALGPAVLGEGAHCHAEARSW